MESLVQVPSTISVHVCVSSHFLPQGGAIGQPNSERDFVGGGRADLPEDGLQPGGHGEEE